MTLLSYAIYRRDPVFIVGQGAGLLIYLRNLRFIYRGQPAPEGPTPDDGAGPPRDPSSGGG